MAKYRRRAEVVEAECIDGVMGPYMRITGGVLHDLAMPLHEFERLYEPVEDEKPKAPEHVCGLMGFNSMLGDECKACWQREQDWLHAKGSM